MSETVELTAEEVLYKSWEGKTISATKGIMVYGDWSLDITFTDGTEFSLWVAQDALHAEEKK